MHGVSGLERTGRGHPGWLSQGFSRQEALSSRWAVNDKLKQGKETSLETTARDVTRADQDLLILSIQNMYFFFLVQKSLTDGICETILVDMNTVENWATV